MSTLSLELALVCGKSSQFVLRHGPGFGTVTRKTVNLEGPIANKEVHEIESMDMDDFCLANKKNSPRRKKGVQNHYQM